MKQFMLDEIKSIRTSNDIEQIVEDIVKDDYNQSEGKEVVIKQYSLLTDYMKEYLEEEYRKNPNWSIKKKREIAAELGIDRQKVYKWNWEQKNKDKREKAVSK